MALIVSREQLERILKKDGELELYPARTEDGVPRFAHACVGEPFARIHIGAGHDHVVFDTVTNIVVLGHQIKKIDAMEMVDFHPCYVYPTIELMIFGKLDRFYMSLLKAIHRPYNTVSDLSERQQFMVPGEGTDESVDAIFYDYLNEGRMHYVESLCGEQGFNTDKLHAYMNAHNLNAGSLWVMLRNKWID